ncbi:MAG: hypothetical protein Q9195_006867 [Heterodermia aff. obscurata]
MATPSPRKRSYADADLDVLAGLEEMVHRELQSVQISPQPQNLPQSSSRSSNQSHDAAQIASPSPSTSTLSTAPDVSPVKFPIANTSIENPSKRQKLTFAEKKARRLEKEAEMRQKAEIRARKDEEKQLRDRQRVEEKALKEEKRQAVLIEREEKRKAREEQDRVKEQEKKLREEEKKLKEEEKNKKERSQLRLNAFFKQPAVSQQEPSGSPVRETASPLGSRRGSISSVHAPDVMSRDRSVPTTPQKPLPVYEKVFPAFFLHSHTTLAPWNRFERDEEALGYICSRLDSSLCPPTEALEESKNQDLSTQLADLLQISVKKTRRPRQPSPTVRDIIAQIQGTSYNPVDLTTSTSHCSKAVQTPLELLHSIPMKSLKFVEDVRPPYIGTCTQLPPGVTAAKLGRNPFGRKVSSLDYDYDSEAEWEAPGEGEDLDSECDDDLEEDDDGEDMKDFVVDESATEVKRRIPILVNTEHTSTGICWEDPQGRSRTAIGDDAPAVDMNQYKLEMLHDDPKLPIDPYSTAYWMTEIEVQPRAPFTSAAMNPPRVPLNAIDRVNQQIPHTAFANNMNQKAAKPVKANFSFTIVTVKKFIAPELLDEFKQAVAGSDSTKLGIVEELKKKFPKQSKGALSDTLTAIADRVGSGLGDKRWVIKAEFQTTAGK